MIINTSGQNIGAQMIDASDGSAFTGTVSAFVTVDGGTQAAGGGTVTHEGNGYHDYTPTQAETNGDHIAFTFTGTGAIPATVEVYTVQILATQASVDVIDGIVDAVLIDTNDLQTNQGDWLTATGFLDATATELAANDALVALHLDHLLAVNYNPASKPGISTALLNELVQSSGGVSQFTPIALEQTSNSGDLLFDGVTSTGSTQALIVMGAGASTDDNFYKHERIVVSNESRLCLAYDGATTTLTLDEPLIAAAPTNNTPLQIRSGGHTFSAAQRLGYTDDTVFINDFTGVAGTIQEINGIQDNPSDSLSDATTIANAHPPAITKFDLSAGTSITLGQGYTNFTFGGRAATVIFGGQVVSNCTIERHFVSGIIDASSTQSRILSCQIVGAVTLPAGAFSDCGIFANITLNAGGVVVLSNVNMSFTVTIDAGSFAGSILLITGDLLKVNLVNLVAGASVNISGNGTLTIDASCTGGTVTHAGDILITDNGAATVVGGTISATYDERGNVNNFLGSSLSETTAANIAANFGIFYDNADAISAQVQDDVGAGAGGGGLSAQETADAVHNLTPAGTVQANSMGANQATIESKVDTIDSVVDTILVDTDDLQTNQGQWLTATGFNTVVPPSLAEFNARTIPSADYFIVTDYTAPDNAGITANGVAIAAINNIWTTAMTESYAANGATMTPIQALYMIWSDLRSPAQNLTTWTDYALDGTTSVMTFSLDDAATPTKKSRT